MKALKALADIASKGLLPIRRNPLFFAFMYALGIICAYAIVPDNGKSHAYRLAWEELFFDVYFCAVLLTLLPRTIMRWVNAAFCAVAYLVAVTDLFCYVKFGSTLTPTMLLLVGETNSSEASEFISSFMNMEIITGSVGLVLLLALVHIIIAVLGKRIRGAFVKAYKTIRIKFSKPQSGDAQPTVSNGKMNGARMIAAPVGGIIAIVLFIYCGSLCIDNKVAFHRLMTYDNIGDVEHELTEKNKAVLYQPLYRLMFSIYANELTSRQLTILKSGLDDIKVDSCSFRSKTIVLIIGESYNRNHAALYGYPTPNTPRQIKRQKRGELTAYTDVVAPWNLTSFVFKHLFSLYAVGDKGNWCDYPLFPELFRKAGYHVTFMTNQFLPQAKEAVYDFSGGFFLNDEELSKAQFDTRNTRLFRFDNGLLCDYEKLKGEGEGKPQLVIFHLKGQHVDYKSRCPSVQKKFNADYYKDTRTDLNTRERSILADYDNAILYNDSIVDAIIGKFEKQDAIVLYVPDHGEECYDGAHFFCRMHSAEITPRLAHAEFEIPFWIWCSSSYRQSHPELVREIKESSNRPYMTDAVPHLLLYLAGISAPQYRDDLNILSPKFNSKRPRLLKHQTDYDELLRKEKAQKEKQQQTPRER